MRVAVIWPVPQRQQARQPPPNAIHHAGIHSLNQELWKECRAIRLAQAQPELWTDFRAHSHPIQLPLDRSQQSEGNFGVLAIGELSDVWWASP